jgi:hypothetical protein
VLSDWRDTNNKYHEAALYRLGDYYGFIEKKHSTEAVQREKMKDEKEIIDAGNTAVEQFQKMVRENPPATEETHCTGLINNLNAGGYDFLNKNAAGNPMVRKLKLCWIQENSFYKKCQIGHTNQSRPIFTGRLPDKNKQASQVLQNVYSRP